MTMTMWLRLITRLVTFLSFWVSKLEMMPSLALEKHLLLVESFISHLCMDRWMQNSIAACYIQSLVTTSKLLSADQRYGYSRAETAMGQQKPSQCSSRLRQQPGLAGWDELQKYGPNVAQFSQEFDFLTHHLKEYRTRSRPRLPWRESSHDHFVNKQGMPFWSPTTYRPFLREILGLPCGINEMRHALVEHFRSSPESSDATLAEFLARLCKHTLRTQISIYDCWTHQEHTSQALCYLVKSALNSILEEPPTTSGATSSDNEQEVDSDDLRSPRELCALIPSDVNTGHPATFLANVLKYTHDGRNAQLAWFRELDTCPNNYEFPAGTDASHEKKNSYPIDIYLHRLEGLYELRTPKRRIFMVVRKPSTQP